MSNEYLHEAARVMGLCLSGSGAALTINPEIDNESLTIYLAIACMTLGKERTRRIVTGELFQSKNTDHQYAVRALDEFAKKQDREALLGFLREMLLVGENRKAVVDAGMDAKLLEYLIQDAASLTNNYTSNAPDPKVLWNKYISLTKAVCEEAQIQIDKATRDKRLHYLEKALKVVGGAAARVTAAKFTGGVSEVLNKLGEIAIDRGLD